MATAEEKPGVKINGVFFPLPESFRLGDPVLVREVTGLTWDEFTAMLEQEEGEITDPSVLTGMIAVSVWQANPKWPRARVVSFVEKVDLSDLETITPETEEETEVPLEQVPVPEPETDGPASPEPPNPS